MNNRESPGTTELNRAKTELMRKGGMTSYKQQSREQRSIINMETYLAGFSIPNLTVQIGYSSVLTKALMGCCLVFIFKVVYSLLKFSLDCDTQEKDRQRRKSRDNFVYCHYEITKRRCDLDQKITIRDRIMHTRENERIDSKPIQCKEGELVRKRNNMANHVRVLEQRNREMAISNCSYYELHKSYPTIPTHELDQMKKKCELYRHKRVTSLKYIL